MYCSFIFYRSVSSHLVLGFFFDQLISSHAMLMNNKRVSNYRLELNQTKGDRRVHIIYVGQICMLLLKVNLLH